MLSRMIPHVVLLLLLPVRTIVILIILNQIVCLWNIVISVHQRCQMWHCL